MVLSNENEQGSMLGSNARYSFGDGVLGNVLILTEHQSDFRYERFTYC
jgi:hypothetical protein